ncbi:MAG: stage II sporulation protein M [Halanaerobiaceae bacterium]|jgi:hypothetical protein|nr:stage II sporulation protein M [Halanaerobiaceae bacterium]
MFDYNNPAAMFFLVLGFYLVPMVIGYILGLFRVVNVVKIHELGKKLGDPLTTKIHNWSRKYIKSSLKDGNWLLLFFTIFLNNLILVALISRIVYGVIFIIPLLLTAWTGFGQGVVFSREKGRSGILLLFFEFGGYLLATVVGVQIGLSIFVSIINKSRLILQIPWDYVLAMVVFLYMGAIIETLILRESAKHMDLSDIENIDFEKRRREIVEELDKDI